jgi:DNA-binding CsgD family transcriptional regulator
MRTSAAPPQLEHGRLALTRGEWDEARASLAHALEARGRSADEEGPARLWAAEAWDGIGLASYWLDDAEAAVDAHERAFRLYRGGGRPARAARAAIWLADHYLTFHGSAAVARGWLERADSLLEQEPAGAEHAWLHVYRGHYALMVEHDAREARLHAVRAREAARAAGAGEAEMMALALEGLALVSEGDVREGMPRLDEASAAAVSRELTDLNATAWACCYLIHGCESVRDFQRAAEWCERVMVFCERWGLRPIFGSCRTHYASVLTWRGRWSEAERELEETVSEARTARPPLVRAALVRLAELRRRQGSLDEAAALLEEAGSHPLALLGQASLALERGRARDALDLARRYLRNVPPRSRTDRVDGLAVLAAAAGAAGDLPEVERAADELDAIAAAVDTPLLWGTAFVARAAAARARGEEAQARAALEDAALLFDEGGAPYEAAGARLLLAELLAAEGRETLARRELEAAGAAFRELGAHGRVQVVAGRLDSLGRGRDAPDAGCPLSARELDVLRLVADGRTNADIAERLYLSPHTVKRHVANILGRLAESSRAAAVARATREGWI